MIDDPEKHFQRLHEATQIWDKPQFTVAEVCKITGTTPKALEHFLNPARGLVRLMGDWVNPGTGKRRIFTGAQVLQIAAAYTMNHIGFPQRWSIGLTEHVARRANARTIGLAVHTELSIVTYPMSNGDWALIPIYKEMTQEPKLPVAVHVLDVDQLIDQVLQQLLAVVAGEDIPDFTVPDIKPEPDWFGPNGGLNAWEQDTAGNWLFVGLTLDETRELMSLKGIRLNGEKLEYDERPEHDAGQRERSMALHEKHDTARFAAMRSSD